MNISEIFGERQEKRMRKESKWGALVRYIVMIDERGLWNHQRREKIVAS